MTEHFPGWDSFGTMIQHVQFVRREGGQLAKIAIATDSDFLSIMPKIVDHFVHAEVRHFDYHDQKPALTWLQQQ